MRHPGDEPTLEWLVDDDGTMWQRVLDSDAWIMLGVAPVPSTAWQGFWHHVGHGLMMQYPIWWVVAFAWRNRRNRRSFAERAVAEFRRAWCQAMQGETIPASELWTDEVPDV